MLVCSDVWVVRKVCGEAAHLDRRRGRSCGCGVFLPA